MKRRPMDRRSFLQTVGVGSLAAAALPTALDMLPTSADAAGQSAPPGTYGFRFVANDVGATIGTVQHYMQVNGDGFVTPSLVSGGGFYNHLDNASPVPKTVLSAGTWAAASLVSFKPAGPPYGMLSSGVVVMKINLYQRIPSDAVIPATLKVVCNIGASGVQTGEDEGFFLDGVEGSPYVPLPVGPAHGLSVFNIFPAGIPLSATPYYAPRHHGMGGPTL